MVEKAVLSCSLQLPQALSAPPAGQASLLSLSFEEIGFDSLNFMEFCISIAMDVGIELSVAEVADLNSPAAVIEHLSQRV